MRVMFLGAALLALSVATPLARDLPQAARPPCPCLGAGIRSRRRDHDTHRQRDRSVPETGENRQDQEHQQGGDRLDPRHADRRRHDP